jgi:hypothetical protein
LDYLRSRPTPPSRLVAYVRYMLVAAEGLLFCDAGYWNVSHIIFLKNRLQS